MTAHRFPYNIVHITDCHDTNPEGGQLAQTLVKIAYQTHARDAGLPTGVVDILPAQAFSTIDVGAKFAEVATRDPLGINLIVAVNTAPPSFANGIDNNARHNFVLGRLKTGTVFGGTWGGHCLSYVKPQIAELYELTSSNNGSQFRSLEVLPEALIDFVTHHHGKHEWTRIDNIDAAIPDAPAQSHAYTIDNFGNVKLWLSDHDRNLIDERLEAYRLNRNRPARSDFDRRAALGLPPEVLFAFDEHALEDGVPASETTSLTFNKASLAHCMFRGEVGQNVFSATSSARRWNASGHYDAVAQLATIRNRCDAPLGFKLPRIGAPLHLRLL